MIDGSRDVTQLQVVATSCITELTDDVADIVRELRALGVIFDASRWTGPFRRGLDTEARHLDLAGADPDLLSLRPRFRIAFHNDAASRPLIDATSVILTESGIGDVDSADPDLLVIASCGEPSRTVFDQPMMDRLAHLPVLLDEDRIRIGPLVRPGQTPCVSCHDRHRTDWDPAWAALLPQLGRDTGIRTPPAIGAVTMRAAALELAAELIAHCDAGQARTIGRFIVVGPRHHERTSWPLAFHHRCGCDLLSDEHHGAA